MPPIQNTSATAPSTSTIKYLTLDEVGAFARVSRRTAEHWVHSGNLLATRRGKHRLVREDVLIRWLEGEDVRIAVARAR